MAVRVSADLRVRQSCQENSKPSILNLAMVVLVARAFCARPAVMMIVIAAMQLVALRARRRPTALTKPILGWEEAKLQQ